MDNNIEINVVILGNLQPCSQGPSSHQGMGGGETLGTRLGNLVVKCRPVFHESIFIP